MTPNNGYLYIIDKSENAYHIPYNQYTHTTKVIVSTSFIVIYMKLTNVETMRENNTKNI